MITNLVETANSRRIDDDVGVPRARRRGRRPLGKAGSKSRVLLIATIWALISGCGGGSADPTKDPAAARFVQFEVKGKATEASARETSTEDKAVPDIPGLYRLGSIKLMLTSYESSDKKCSLEPQHEVMVFYTATTSFAPAEITEHGKFPRSLDGRALNIRGKVFGVGGSCVPVAEHVTDAGVLASEESARPADKTAEQRPVEERRPVQAKDAGRSGRRQAEGTAATPGNEPVSSDALEVPALPPLAPEVKTIFRPSLPDPPTG